MDGDEFELDKRYKTKCETCGGKAIYNFRGSNIGIRCHEHKEVEMIYINKRCYKQGCLKYPSYNFEGEKLKKFCKQHSENGMVNLNHIFKLFFFLSFYL